MSCSSAEGVSDGAIAESTEGIEEEPDNKPTIYGIEALMSTSSSGEICCIIAAS